MPRSFNVFAAACTLALAPLSVGAVNSPSQDEHEEQASPAKPAMKSDAPAEKFRAANTPPLGSREKPASPPIAPAAAKVGKDEAPVTATRALEILKDGNTRWVAGNDSAPNTDSARRADQADNGQKPFVTVLTCADSRIPVERVFDRGVGEIFAVRVAGNVAGGSEVGTIEYGTGHLHTPLLIVMGHTKCGAVGAAASGAEVHGAVADLVSHIAPAVERARKNNPGAKDDEIAAAAVRENVWQTIFDLYKASPETRAMSTRGELTVIGAIYDIKTGKVEWLGPHPWEAELIEALDARAAKASTTEAAAAEQHGGEHER